MRKEDKDAIGPLVFFSLLFIAIAVGVSVNHYYSFHRAEKIFTDVMNEEIFDTENLGSRETPYFSYMLDATPENGTREVEFVYTDVNKSRCHSYYIKGLRVFLIDKNGHEIEGYWQWVGWTWGIIFDYVPAGRFQLVSRGRMKTGF